MATSEKQEKDWSWLLLPFLVLALCTPAFLVTGGAGH